MKRSILIVTAALIAIPTLALANVNMPIKENTHTQSITEMPCSDTHQEMMTKMADPQVKAKMMNAMEDPKSMMKMQEMKHN
ncbi:hypothetical protein HWV00_05235 [Moritella sp. 24]|uniref:hypothetical protein n=1 Tax=Moritella sp. 24 TaxID=2746230 RepID=UPI001BA98E42|nr:hypothetical protein [Moritella sp. 24]QUM75687.1 hypothetical protein HWV00_05235 [Moritella sp. 24]